jgi:hypothetical protein
MTNGEHTFTVRRVVEQQWSGIVILICDDGDSMVIAGEDYEASKIAISKATDTPVAQVTLEGMTLTVRDGVPVPPAS